MQALHGNHVCGGVSATATQRVRSRAAMRVRAAVDMEQLKGAKKDLAKLISDSKCNPIIVRLGWHDAGTYDDSKKNEPWPIGAGATGSIRYLPELEHAANSGLAGALELLNPIHEKYPNVSFADMYQMASAVAIEVAGGPKMEMRYGRADVEGAHHCAQEGFLPSAGHPFPDGSKKPGDHLRKVFYRMGFNDQEIVALSGAHTLGRSRPERSGWGKAETKYTKDGPGKPGGQSWTVNWLHFDNSYFTEVKAKRDAELLVLPTDAALYEDEGFRPHAEKYAADEKAFFEDYAKAHVKLSELGVKWVEGAPVTGI